jgi:hypothetical protein
MGQREIRVNAAGIRRRYFSPDGCIRPSARCRNAVFRLPPRTGGAANRNFKLASGNLGLEDDMISVKKIIKPIAEIGEIAHNYKFEILARNFERQ